MSEAAVIGVSCHLPGAASVDAFWSLLRGGRNALRQRPAGRWSVERFLRVGEPEPGFAYTFAGGYLNDPFAFDPAPFGISPRESQQMDPQQRLLLEMTWHALEDAGIPPLSLSGKDVGVYVGASMVDYQNGASHDPAVVESHFMTGNSLAVLSNRISYGFDLHGPSFTLDSACSSSFVAISQAMAALRDGQIDMAIVGGVNLLLSPAPFIGFSQARMLSPTGASRPFSQDADGYARAEGAVVFVLRRLEDAVKNGDRIRSVLVGAAVNSDGRTSGISLPSLEGQRRLIEDLHTALDIDPEQLSFVEAHGTGTKVGDPIEAQAIGLALGQKRKAPLPIGSVKSNIGHLEPASGLAGLLKSSLALEHGILPRSLFLDRPNTAIDFVALNLAPNGAERKLQAHADAPMMACVCNYGFGGTNAHVVLRAPSEAERAAVARSRKIQAGDQVSPPAVVLVGAATEAALRAKARTLADMLDVGAEPEMLASALGHQQELQKVRLAIPLSSGADVKGLLSTFAQDGVAGKGLETGKASGDTVPLAFIFSGNGSQFGEMGKAAYAASPAFKAEIDAIDALFEPLADWSLRDAIASGIDEERLQRTSVSQPLIYAIQSALCAVLRRYGIHPAAVLGHSVGEVAAAEVAGALTRPDAVRLIHLRSRHQEGVRGLGRMLVVAADAEAVSAELAGPDFAGLEIAATNSPTSTTVAGPAEPLALFSRHCRKRRLATVALDIDYPFHSPLLDPLREAMVEDLAFLPASDGEVTFISTVTGGELAGSALSGPYWWDNVRCPVRFDAGIRTAAAKGISAFIEIGPRAILTGPIAEVLRATGVAAEVVSSLSAKDGEGPDPVLATVARLVALGARFDRELVCGSPGEAFVELPRYPFQHADYTLQGTHEAMTAYGRMWLAEGRHPLLGARMADDSPEWRSLLDIALVPYLSDHRVDGGVIVPAAGLIEIALAAGREIFGETPLELDEFDIFKALAFADDEAREVSTRYFDTTGTIEIWSRRRFSTQEWALHARGTISVLNRARSAPLAPPVEHKTIHDTAAEVYAEATRAGLEYGPLFQLVTASARDAVTTDAQLSAPSGGLGAFEERHIIHPASLDAAFHGLFISRPQKDGETKAHLPVRFRKICIYRHGAKIRRAITLLTHETNRFKTVAITLFDDVGEVVASVEAAVLRALYLSKATIDDRTFREVPQQLDQIDLAQALEAALGPAATGDATLPDGWLVARALAVSIAYETLTSLMTETGATTLAALRGHICIADAGRPYFDALVAVLEDFGVLTGVDAVRTLVAENPLPASKTLLGTLITRCPEATLELRLAAMAATRARSVLERGDHVMPGAHMLRRLEVDGLVFAPVVAALSAALATLAADAKRPLRVLALEPWGAALDRICRPLLDRGAIELTLASANRSAIETHRVQHGAGNIEYVLLADGERTPSVPGHDLLIYIASRPMLRAELEQRTAIRALMADEAMLLAAVPSTDCYLDVLCGCWSGWLSPAKSGENDLLRVPTPEEASELLTALGATQLSLHELADGPGHLLVGRAPSSVETVMYPAHPAALAIVPGEAAIDPLVAHLASQSLAVGGVVDWIASQPAEVMPTLIIPPHGRGLGKAAETAARIDHLKALFDLLTEQDRPVRMFVLTQGASEASEADSAVYGFVRVAINEFPGIDIRLVDLHPTMGTDEVAAAIRPVINQPGAEREWCIGVEGASVNRIRRGLEPEQLLADGERSLLRFDQPGRLESFEWVRTARLSVASDEIEIEVAGVGLNFRDVLVGLGILDDDLLGAGLTAASLGFECSGIVTRIGVGITDLAVGDRVMGFAKDVFSSHVVAPAWQFFPVPPDITIEAAATVPVAFATAWFALMERARLRKGMDVLVHGGAGGVGLAAIQIAKRVGARVIATASSEERRAIALAAGADLAYDSRNERFAEAITRDIGGVDVVLNSLAGPAMVASFKLVKPFGSFIELGKRDYLDNSQLGLRPFIRNIAYIGVDLDELLSHDRTIIREMMATLAEMLASGEMRPLPYQVYEAHEIGAAFRSMQASEHVGKIVIRPARQARRDFGALTFKAREGVYLVVGGTSGLGFATAHWLARKGASTLVLASRRGALEEGLGEAVAEMKAAGAKVLVEALDVTSADAVAALVARVTKAHGPLRGIVHAAVLLDDGMIVGLTPERLRAVLLPKVQGALNLEAAAEGQPLDFFVVYSSATTVIGSPGQGAYVAANAFLEGFARRRRAEGKPALAIGWGAIADVGIIARDKQLGQRLRRTTGVVGIKSSEGLAHLGRLLTLGDAVGPMQFYTNISPGAAAEKLALLNSPAFAGLALARREEDGEEGGDLVSAIAGKPKAEALLIVTQALRREVSHILRMPIEQIEVERPLGELGLDSLMALELALSIERLSGREVPMIGAGDRRLIDIADNILGYLTAQGSSDEVEAAADASLAVITTLVQKHTTVNLSPEELQELQGKVTARTA